MRGRQRAYDQILSRSSAGSSGKHVKVVPSLGFEVALVVFLVVRDVEGIEVVV